MAKPMAKWPNGQAQKLVVSMGYSSGFDWYPSMLGHPASWPSKRGSNIVSLYEDHIIASLRRSARL